MVQELKESGGTPAILTMTPEQFTACLNLVHWSQRQLASILNVPRETVLEWGRGERSIPSDVVLWLKKRADHAQLNPPPRSPTVEEKE
ncbi:nuclease [Saccharibacter sp. EH611]|uniref:nuclease n=1 Tax=Saccharibacter sp. EH611 TaxID=2689391 RepID=UPI00132C7871|nr:nuclease [Saccharibacter sp. EH611]MXV35618.1 nuclease [Saccharibacter sp. EH611]